MTIDEAYHWFDRVDRFGRAVQSGDYAGTNLIGHPGVTTMWLGMFGDALFHWAATLGLVAANEGAASRALIRLPLGVVAAGCVVLAYPLLRRLFDQRIALVATLLWATEPFLIAHAQLLHLDSLLTSFMMISMLFMLRSGIRDRGSGVGGQSLESRTHLQNSGNNSAFSIQHSAFLLSAFFAGLALLTKSPSVGLLPVVALILAFQGWRQAGVAGLPRAALYFGLWSSLAALIWVALWPAAWLDLRGTLGRVFLQAQADGGSPHGWGNYFLGQAIADPGPLFYLIAGPLRMAPWTFLGVLIAAAFGLKTLVKAWRTNGLSEFLHDHYVSIMLIVFVLLFTIMMSIPPKKFDRYLLPIFPALDILAAVGLVRLGRGGQGSGTVGQSDSQTVRQSDSRTVRQWGSGTVRQWGSGTVGQPDSRTVGQSDSRTVGQSDSRTVGQEPADTRPGDQETRRPGDKEPAAPRPPSPALRPPSRSGGDWEPADPEAQTLNPRPHTPESPVPRALWLVGGCLLIANLLWYHPYELAYYNPLLGGATTALRSIPVGWGEGHELAGDFIWAQPDGADLPVAALYGPALDPFVPAGAAPMDWALEPGKVNYAVVYIDQIQRRYKPELFDPLRQNQPPLHTVSVHGIPYAEIYAIPPAVTQLSGVSFGDAIRLHGYSLDASELHSGGVLTVTLAWQARGKPERDYNLFVHVFDQQNTRVAQVDLAAGEPRWPTSAWRAGHFIRQVQRIPMPAELTTGRYRVVIGLYDPQSFQRLTLDPGAARDPLDGNDALLLGEVEK